MSEAAGPQGNRMKLREPEQGEEVVVVPSCPLSFDLDADLGGFLLFAETQSKPAKDGLIAGGISVPYPIVVLTKGDVENPVELVLDFPVVAENFGKALDVIGQTGDMELTKLAFHIWSLMFSTVTCHCPGVLVFGHSLFRQNMVII